MRLSPTPAATRVRTSPSYPSSRTRYVLVHMHCMCTAHALRAHTHCMHTLHRRKARAGYLTRPRSFAQPARVTEFTREMWEWRLAPAAAAAPRHGCPEAPALDLPCAYGYKTRLCSRTRVYIETTNRSKYTHSSFERCSLFAVYLVLSIRRRNRARDRVTARPAPRTWLQGRG